MKISYFIRKRDAGGPKKCKWSRLYHHSCLITRESLKADKAGFTCLVRIPGTQTGNAKRTFDKSLGKKGVSLRRFSQLRKFRSLLYDRTKLKLLFNKIRDKHPDIVFIKFELNYYFRFHSNKTFSVHERKRDV